MPAQERLRQIAWELGQNYPIPFTSDYLALAMVRPFLGHAHWHVRADSLDALRAQAGGAGHHAPVVLRLYDVTDVVFDGFNAHRILDFEIKDLTGVYYFNIDRPARHYLGEIGLRCHDGSFRALVRSNSVLLDRDRPAGNFQLNGLYVGGPSKRTFTVENIFDARVYEHMSRELVGIERMENLAVALIWLGLHPAGGLNSPLGQSMKTVAERLRKFGVETKPFSATLEESPEHAAVDMLLGELDRLSRQVAQDIRAVHAQQPFHLLHAHDWYSAAAGLVAAKALRLPLLLSLHSTEHERTEGNIHHPLAAAIFAREQTAAREADMVIVPHSSTRQQVINLYGAVPDDVVIVPDVPLEDTGGPPRDPATVKGWFDQPPDAPLVLFAGAISHATGADLMMDALPQVCGRHGSAFFVFVGDGPLKSELEGRAWHGGIGHRCRFLGDVNHDTFEALLMACEYVAIPARTWQDEGLAQHAINAGKPVLTTHQAGIRCVKHGENGLVTYDNPGSIVWGLQELLANPLHGSMLRLVARRKSAEGPSLESVAVQHYLHYEILFKHSQGTRHG